MKRTIDEVQRALVDARRHYEATCAARQAAADQLSALANEYKNLCLNGLRTAVGDPLFKALSTSRAITAGEPLIVDATLVPDAEAEAAREAPPRPRSPLIVRIIPPPLCSWHTKRGVGCDAVATHRGKFPFCDAHACSSCRERKASIGLTRCQACRIANGNHRCYEDAED